MNNVPHIGNSLFMSTLLFGMPDLAIHIFYLIFVL